MIEGLFRAVMRALPREFRDRFGAEMLDTARAIDGDRRRRSFAHRLRACADALGTPVQLYLEERRHTPRVRSSFMDWMFRDLQTALRGFRREKGFTAFVVVTLALGLGANTAMFGIADRLLLSGPAHIVDADRVVRLYSTEQPAGMREFTMNAFGYVTFDLMRTRHRGFAEVAMYSVSEAVMGSANDARPIRVGYGSEGLFPLLRVRPIAGRAFSGEENAPGAAARVALVTRAGAEAWFGGIHAAPGRTIVIDDRPHTIIGVLPHGFTGPQLTPVDVWLPANLLAPAITAQWQTTWYAQWTQIVARLAPGVTREQASEEATSVHRAAYTGTDAATAKARLFVAPLGANEIGTDAVEVRVLRWLTGVALVVLLIACANVGNLMLARGLRRTREVALRAALGASRARLVRLMLVETVLLSCAGAALGLFIAHAVGTVARQVLFANVFWASPPVNLRVMAMAFALAFITGVIVGVVPALRATRARVGEALRTGVREGGGRRAPLRTTLTIVQATLSVVLLMGAGLFVRSLWNVRSIDLGFDADRVHTVEITRQSLARVPEGPARDAERLRRQQFFYDLLPSLERIPGVERAAVASGTPFGNRFSVQMRAPDLPKMPRLSTGGPSVSAVTPSYFETMGTRIVRGRGFAPDEGAGTEPIAIVSQTMAATLWPSDDAIGKCLLVGEGTPPCARIVGIAENTHRGRLREDPVMHAYIPAGQEVQFSGRELLIRTSDTTGAVIAEVRRLVASRDPAITYVRADTIQERRLNPQMQPWRIGATVFVLSGVLALIVAATGIYSVMSYLVSDRRHEIGVRLALGARPGDISRLVVRGSVVMAASGVAAGVTIALLLGRFVEPLLFDLSPRDPITIAGVSALLLLVAVVASYLPARRAQRVPAIEALRS